MYYYVKCIFIANSYKQSLAFLITGFYKWEFILWVLYFSYKGFSYIVLAQGNFQILEFQNVKTRIYRCPAPLHHSHTFRSLDSYFNNRYLIITYYLSLCKHRDLKLSLTFFLITQHLITIGNKNNYLLEFSPAQLLRIEGNHVGLLLGIDVVELRSWHSSWNRSGCNWSCCNGQFLEACDALTLDLLGLLQL